MCVSAKPLPAADLTLIFIWSFQGDVHEYYDSELDSEDENDDEEGEEDDQEEDDDNLEETDEE